MDSDNNYMSLGAVCICVYVCVWSNSYPQENKRKVPDLESEVHPGTLLLKCTKGINLDWGIQDFHGKYCAWVVVSLDCPVGGRRTDHKMKSTPVSREFLKRRGPVCSENLEKGSTKEEKVTKPQDKEARNWSMPTKKLLLKNYYKGIM